MITIIVKHIISICINVQYMIRYNNMVLFLCLPIPICLLSSSLPSASLSTLPSL